MMSVEVEIFKIYSYIHQNGMVGDEDVVFYLGVISVSHEAATTKAGIR